MTYGVSLPQERPCINRALAVRVHREARTKLEGVMNDSLSFSGQLQPTAARPLLGLTILMVEDSRYACDAARLLCVHSGARLRRADCLASAHRHLEVYRPSVIIIDMGLPDGSGADLIRQVSQATPRISAILATSGDPFAEHCALAAGADGFLAKPLVSVAVFQNKILSLLPQERRPIGPRTLSDESVVADPIAYRDDMAHAPRCCRGRRICPASIMPRVSYRAWPSVQGTGPSRMPPMPCSKRGCPPCRSAPRSRDCRVLSMNGWRIAWRYDRARHGRVADLHVLPMFAIRSTRTGVTIPPKPTMILAMASEATQDLARMPASDRDALAFAKGRMRVRPDLAARERPSRQADLWYASHEGLEWTART